LFGHLHLSRDEVLSPTDLRGHNTLIVTLIDDHDLHRIILSMLGICDTLGK
jgi:hypothetical protein